MICYWPITNTICKIYEKTAFMQLIPIFTNPSVFKSSLAVQNIK